MASNASRSLGIVHLIGAMKLCTAVVAVAAVLGLFRVFRGDAADGLEHFARRLHLDPENHLLHAVIERVAGLRPGQRRLIEAATLFYATLHTVEGIGLLTGKRWGAFLTILATGSLIPLECFEIYRKPAPLRLAVLVVNVAILIYLYLHRDDLARVHLRRGAESVHPLPAEDDRCVG